MGSAAHATGLALSSRGCVCAPESVAACVLLGVSGACPPCVPRAPSCRVVAASPSPAPPRSAPAASVRPPRVVLVCHVLSVANCCDALFRKIMALSSRVDYHSIADACCCFWLLAPSVCIRVNDDSSGSQDTGGVRAWWLWRQYGVIVSIVTRSLREVVACDVWVQGTIHGN